MSQEIREKALGAAVTVAGAMGDDAVVVAANKFVAFLTGDASPKVSAVTSASAKTSASSAPAATASKPTATKAASGSVTTASKVTKPPTASKKPEVDPDAKKMVGDKVNEMLRANKREEAVALLASFDGAQSATSIVMQGDAVVEAFMTGADEILSAESGSLAD